MRPVINTRKHIVQESLFTVASGAIRTSVIANAQQDVDVAVPAEVQVGSKISALYIEMWLTSDDATQGTAIVTLEKLPGAGSGTMTAVDSAALNIYDNKKNVLHTFMGLIGTNIQYPTAAIKGWFKIPKGKQRMGVEDRFILNIHGQSNGMQGCGFYLFKEQF